MTSSDLGLKIATTKKQSGCRKLKLNSNDAKYHADSENVYVNTFSISRRANEQKRIFRRAACVGAEACWSGPNR